MERFWSAVDKLTTVGVAYLNVDRRLIRCNRVFAALSGCDKQALEDRDFIAEYIAREDRLQAVEWFDSLINDETSHCHSRVRIECPIDLTRQLCDIECVKIVDGNHPAVILFATKLADGHEMMSLREKMQELTELVANLSSNHGVTFNVAGTDGRQIANDGGQNTDDNSVTTTNSSSLLIIMTVFLAAVVLGLIVMVFSGRLNINTGGENPTRIEIESPERPGPSPGD